jgi:tRNA threonylcarbamoyladenosine biosynthesis protein TsaE
LGAGKTCLTQGIAWGLGVEGYARSPTFVIVTRYVGRLVLHHVDLFRVQGYQEAQDLGLDEYLSGEDVCVVEWADRAAEAFPPGSVWIALEYGPEDTERLVTIRDVGKGDRPAWKELSRWARPGN